MARTDIRVQFTQKVLQESLVALMKVKPILSITTKEICDAAGLSRSTFYTYYNNQYDLLRKIEEQTFIEMDKILQPHLNSAKKASGLKITTVLEDTLQFVANNSNSIQVLLSKNGDSDFQKKFFHKSIEHTRRFTTAVGVKPPEGQTSEYGSVFVVGGLLTLVQEWLNNGMDMPVPELAKMLACLTREVLR
jgi:AcrR family transcriptional regulator